MRPELSHSHPRLERAAYSIPEFAARYGLSRASIYRMAKRGQLKLTKIGSRTVILTADEAKMVAKLEGSR
jgi:predicted DNA-binding transcriptional regulator AlpA